MRFAIHQRSPLYAPWELNFNSPLKVCRKAMTPVRKSCFAIITLLMALAARTGRALAKARLSWNTRQRTSGMLNVIPT